jgi:hypothetical protein
MENSKKVGLVSNGQPASFVSFHRPQFDALKEKNFFKFVVQSFWTLERKYQFLGMKLQ